MSEKENCGKSTLGNNETDMHRFSVKVEYYRSFEYSLKWNNTMYPTRPSKQLKASKDQDQPSSSEESIQRRVRVRRQPAWLKNEQSEDTGVGAESDEVCVDDIIDIINREHQLEEKTTEENGAVLVEVADDRVDESDDDRVSSNGSVMSGPHLDFSPANLCSACRKVYQKAKRMKAPLKDKCLDNNPKSLTCDQWILIKHWKGRKTPNSRGNRLVTNQMIRNLHVVREGIKRRKLTVAKGQLCARPHIFLQRNLRCCVKRPLKKERKKNRRKRSREDSRNVKQQPLHNRRKRSRKDSKNVKQQPLHNNSHLQPSTSTSSTQNHSPLDPIRSHCSSLSSESGSEDLTINITPASVGLKRSDKIKDTSKENVQTRADGFKELLAQLRGKSNIVREMRR